MSDFDQHFTKDSDEVDKHSDKYNETSANTITISQSAPSISSTTKNSRRRAYMQQNSKANRSFDLSDFFIIMTADMAKPVTAHMLPSIPDL